MYCCILDEFFVVNASTNSCVHKMIVETVCNKTIYAGIYYQLL